MESKPIQVGDTVFTWEMIRDWSGKLPVSAWRRVADLRATIDSEEAAYESPNQD